MLKRIISTTLVLVTIVSIIPTALLIYFKTIGRNKIPSALTSTYVTLQHDYITGESLPFIEMNLYDGMDDGKRIVEIRFNAYSGVDCQYIYSRGFQLELLPNNTATFLYDDVYYYDSFNGHSFTSLSDFNWEDVNEKKETGTPLIVKIEGKPYAVKLDGTKTITETKLNFNFFDWKNTPLIYEEKTTINYRTSEFLLYVADFIRSLSDGVGESFVPLVDMANFLHVYEINDKGQISGSPIGYGKFTSIASYFTAKVNYSKRAMTTTRQSLFNSVLGDGTYNVTGIEEGKDYYQARVQLNVTESDFDFNYSTIDGGYYASLKVDKFIELNKYGELVDVNVNFDLSKITDKKVLGFDYLALEGVELASLKITSNTLCDFILKLDALKDTGLMASDVELVNVNLIDNSGVN